jgi:hypothetical protein
VVLGLYRVYTLKGECILHRQRLRKRHPNQSNRYSLTNGRERDRYHLLQSCTKTPDSPRTRISRSWRDQSTDTPEKKATYSLELISASVPLCRDHVHPLHKPINKPCFTPARRAIEIFSPSWATRDLRHQSCRSQSGPSLGISFLNQSGESVPRPGKKRPHKTG